MAQMPMFRHLNPFPSFSLHIKKINPTLMYSLTGILNFEADICEHLSSSTSSLRWNFPAPKLAFNKDRNTPHITLKFGTWLLVI